VSERERERERKKERELNKTKFTSSDGGMMGKYFLA
jgi:hypothetical protein